MISGTVQREPRAAATRAAGVVVITAAIITTIITAIATTIITAIATVATGPGGHHASGASAISGVSTDC